MCPTSFGAQWSKIAGNVSHLLFLGQPSAVTNCLFWLALRRDRQFIPTDNCRRTQNSLQEARGDLESSSELHPGSFIGSQEVGAWQFP